MQDNLIRAALAVRNNAQAPYSRYHVGASVLSISGAIYAGCNVERCSYSQTTHAEQNAIDSMIASEGPTSIAALAIVAAPADTHFDIEKFQNKQAIESPPPFGCCGHCLQIIWENCEGNKTIPLYFVEQAQIYQTTIGKLLPYPFGPSNLYSNSESLTK